MLDFNDALPQSFWDQPRATDKEEIKDRLNGSARAFVRSILPRAIFTGQEARVGNVDGEPGGSLSICLNGPETGKWYDHATGEAGGDFLSLYQAVMKCDFPTAVQETSHWLGDASYTPRARNVITSRIERHKDKPDPPKDQRLHCEAQYQYRQKNGDLNATVYRYRNLDGTKTFRMRRADGQWRAPEIRTLYNLENIHDKPRVVVVEGEKCVDALASVGIDATSHMGGAKAPLSQTDWTPLAGKHVILWPDNDEPGQELMDALEIELDILGCKVERVNVPERVSGWDAADALADGEDVETILRGAAKPDEDALVLSNFADGEIPQMRDWLYEPLLIGGCLTVIPAPPGTGKTTFSLQLAVNFAMGRTFSGCHSWKAGNVLIVNGEEPEHEIRRRFMAACVEHDFNPSEVANRVHWVSGYDLPKGICLAHYDAKSQTVQRGADAKRIIDAARSINAKLIILDPAAELASIEENSNPQQKEFGRIMRNIAMETGCAVLAFTHTPKSATGEDAGDPYVIRGGGAMVGVARVVATLFNMSEKDGKALNVEKDKVKLYARLDMGKANMSDPTGNGVTWFKKTPHEIASGDIVATLHEVDMIPPSLLKQDAEKAKAEKFWAALTEDVIDVLERQGGRCSVSFYARNANHDKLGFKWRSVFDKVKNRLSTGPIEQANKRVSMVGNDLILEVVK
jgi:5S rRNA maturation endonuclease (ribonuclease M5)